MSRQNNSFADSQPLPPGGGLGPHRTETPAQGGAAQSFDVKPCRGAFQLQKAGGSRNPIPHRHFSTAEAAAGRLIAAGQGDTFEILQVVARVTLGPRGDE